MDHGGGGAGDSAQMFWFGKDSRLHHFQAPQEGRVPFPTTEQDSKGVMKRNAVD